MGDDEINGAAGVRQSKRVNKGVPPQKFADMMDFNVCQGKQFFQPLKSARSMINIHSSTPTEEPLTSKSVIGTMNFSSIPPATHPLRRMSSNVSLASTSSHRSTTSQKIKRLSEIELKVAEERAQLAVKELEIQRILLDKKEEFLKAMVEEDSSDDDEMEQPRFQLNKNAQEFQPRKQTSNTITDRARIPEVVIPASIPPATTVASTQVATNESVRPREPVEKFIARQSSARDLPPFSGNPEEWINFYYCFQRSTNLCEYSDDENIYRLQKALKGKAKEVVQSMMTCPENLTRILETLELNFGRPELLIRILVDKVRKLPAIKDEKFEMIMEFSNEMQNLVATMENLKSSEHVYNPFLMTELTAKLPPMLRFQWGSVIAEAEEKPNLSTFADWLRKQARAARYSSSGNSSFEIMSGNSKPGGRTEKKESVHSTVQSIENDIVAKCNYCNKNNHKIEDCRYFKNDDVDKRWAGVKRKGLCFKCLETGHSQNNCSSAKNCTVNSCGKSHHKMLHKDFPSKKAEPEQVQHSSQPPRKKILLRIAPVTIYGPTTSVKTYALFDEGSTTTLIDDTLANKLNLPGSCEPLTLQWANSVTHTEDQSRSVTFKIAGAEEKESFEIRNARTSSSLNLCPQSYNMKDLQKKFSHLQKINLDSMVNAKPQILIGQDNYDLIVPREIIEGPKNSPYVTKTALGWVLHGNVNYHISRIDANIVLSSWEKNPDPLHKLVADFFETESFGIQPNCLKSNSPDLIRAEKLLKETTTRIGDRFQTGLLWAEDDVKLPESKTNAFNRLRATERKMDRDPHFKLAYTEKINDFIKKGYCRKLQPNEVQNDARVWYLPHFGVLNPNKPGKLRFVFDAAAKSQGVSLNDKLFKGPDYLLPLPSVLFKFRQKEIGFGGDIKEMFPQVKIRSQDSTAQYFLWRGNSRTTEPDVYMMESMIFGATCSPSSAQYVKNLNARVSK